MTDVTVLHWANRRYFLDQKKKLKMMADSATELLRRQRLRQFGTDSFTHLPVNIIHVLARLLPLLVGSGDSKGKTDGLIPGLKDVAIKVRIIFDNNLDNDQLRKGIDAAERLCEFMMAPWMWRNGAPEDAFRCGVRLTGTAIANGHWDENAAKENQSTVRAAIALAENTSIEEVPVIEPSSCNDAVHRLVTMLLRNDSQLVRLVKYEHPRFFKMIHDIAISKLDEGELDEETEQKAKLVKLFAVLFAHCDSRDPPSLVQQCWTPSWITAFDLVALKLDDVPTQLKLIEELVCGHFSEDEVQDVLKEINEDAIENGREPVIKRDEDDDLPATVDDDERRKFLQFMNSVKAADSKSAQILINHMFDLVVIVADLRFNALPLNHWKSHAHQKQDLNTVQVEQGTTDERPVQTDFRQASSSYVTDIGLRMDGYYDLSNFGPAANNNQHNPFLKWIKKRESSKEHEARMGPLMEQLSQLSGQTIRASFMEPPNFIQERELTFKVTLEKHGRVTFTDVMIDGSTRNVIPSYPVPVTIDEGSIPFRRVCLFSPIPGLHKAQIILKEKASIIALSLNFEATALPDEKIPDAVKLHT